MIKAIIFDLDDTLYNEIDFVKSGYKVIANHLSKKYNLEKKYIYDELIELFNISSKNVFNRLHEKLSINYNDNDIKELIKIYREHFPNIKLKEEVIETLIKLKKEGYILGIISDGEYITQKNKCNSLHLEKYIDKIILTDQYGKEFWKPNPYAFKLFLNEYNVNEENLIYVGDNPKKDFYIKKNLNIKTVRIDNPNGVYYQEKYLENIKEDYKIKNIKELINLIETI